MPINLIDIVSAAPKSQELLHHKHAEHQKSFNEQTQIATMISSNIKHNSQMTVKTTQSENNEKRYDAKEKGNTSYSSKGQKKKENEKDEKKNKDIQTSSFDMRI